MKIAITGGTGFIGHYLLPELVREGFRVRCLTRRKDLETLPQHNGVEYVYCDGSKESMVQKLEACDCLIHMGSIVPGNAVAEDEIAAQFVQNIRYSADLFDACRVVNIKNVVFLSSIAVYGNQGTEPYVESQRCDPNSIYGVMKISIEKIAGYYHDAYGLNIKSLRVSQVFGARSEPKSPFLRMCVDKCLHGEALTIFGTGTTKMDYVYVKDVCNAIVLALEKTELHGEYNIGNGRAISTEELALAYCQGFSNPKGIVYQRSANEKMFHRSLEIAKAKNELGYEPRYTLVQACTDMYEIYKRQEILPK